MLFVLLTWLHANLYEQTLVIKINSQNASNCEIRLENFE